MNFIHLDAFYQILLLPLDLFHTRLHLHRRTLTMRWTNLYQGSRQLYLLLFWIIDRHFIEANSLPRLPGLPTHLDRLLACKWFYYLCFSYLLTDSYPFPYSAMIYLDFIVFSNVFYPFFQALPYSIFCSFLYIYWFLIFSFSFDLENYYLLIKFFLQ